MDVKLHLRSKIEIFYQKLTEKRERLHFMAFYLLVFIYIIFGSLLFNSDLFFNYFAIIILAFAILCGYIRMIFESFRPDRGQWRSILTVFLSCFLLIIIPKALLFGFEPLSKFNSHVLKTALVEEVVFRSLMFGMVLNLWQIKLHAIEKYRFKIYLIQIKDLKIVVFLILLISMAFSIFHFWDLHNNMRIPTKAIKLFFDRFILGAAFSVSYLISGQKVYPSIALHYANNIYGLNYLA